MTDHDPLIDRPLPEAPITRVGIMLDLETIGTGVRAPILQVAFIAFDLDDPDNRFRKVEEYLPITPQVKTFSRHIDFDTMLFWQKKPNAVERFANNTGDDFDELDALVKSVNSKMTQAISDRYHEVWARGINFDLPIWESLLTDLGQQEPYRYDSGSDLRTIMREAGITKKDVERPAKWPEHHALSDCEYQIDCLAEAWRRIRAR